MNDFFKYQLDTLNWELRHIDGGIRQIDQMANNIKNWAIGLWGGSIGLVLLNDEIRIYVGLTFVIPLLFWLVDARWRKIQRSLIYRLNKISEYINSQEFENSFKQEKLINFTLLDPRAKRTKGDDYDSFIGMKKVLTFGSVSWLYIGLIGISLLLQIFYLAFVM